MNDLQNWIDQLDPLVAFAAMGGVFLVASVAGWYVGDLMLWARSKIFTWSQEGMRRVDQWGPSSGPPCV